MKEFFARYLSLPGTGAPSYMLLDFVGHAGFLPGFNDVSLRGPFQDGPGGDAQRAADFIWDCGRAFFRHYRFAHVRIIPVRIILRNPPCPNGFPTPPIFECLSLWDRLASVVRRMRPLPRGFWRFGRADSRVLQQVA